MDNNFSMQVDWRSINDDEFSFYYEQFIKYAPLPRAKNIDTPMPEGDGILGSMSQLI